MVERAGKCAIGASIWENHAVPEAGRFGAAYVAVLDTHLRHILVDVHQH